MTVGVVKSVAFSDGLAISGTVGVGSGSGEKNYVTSPSTYDAATSSSAVGWYISGGTASTITATLPRANTTGSAIQFVSTNSGDYLRYRFALDTADLSKKLKVVFSQIVAASGDYKLEVYYGSDAALSGATRIYTSTDDTTPQTLLPGATCDFMSTFDTNTNGYIEVRWVATGASKTLKISDVTVGPGLTTQGAVVGDWETWTPTGTWTTNVTYTGFRRRVGGDLQCKVRVLCSGAPDSTTLNISLPNGLVIDSTRGPSATGEAVGFGNILDSGTRIYGAFASWKNSTSVDIYCDFLTSGTSGLVSQSNPFTFGANDTVEVFFTVPIVGWASTVNFAQNDIDYASNSSTSDADDTSSFVSGSSGSVGIFGTTTLTAARKKRCRWPSPTQPGDLVLVQLYDATAGDWVLPNQHRSANFSYQTQKNVEYGITTVGVNATDVDVYFSKYGSPTFSSGAAFGDAGTDWASLSATIRWRLIRIRGGAATGFAQMGQNSLGLAKAGQVVGTNTNDSAIAGNVGERLDFTGTLSNVNKTTYTVSSAAAIPAGNWDVFVFWNASSFGDASGITSQVVGISTSNATDSTGLTAGSNRLDVPANAAAMGGVLGPVSVKLAATTNYYFKTLLVGSAATTVGLTYRIIANRVR